jgi:integrase
VERGQAAPRRSTRTSRGRCGEELLRQGVHPKVVQERLGHANVSITLDIYSHCTANMQEEAAAKIDEALAAALAG